jgi:hypothetical protein
MRGYGDDSNILLGQRVQSSELEPCSVGSRKYSCYYLFSFINNQFIIVSFIIVLLYCFVLLNMTSGLHH